jgi:hypothetical protein
MAYGAVILAAVAVRVATDLVITTRWMHLAIAGTLGVVVLGLWAWKWIALFFRFPART